jgi:hypothetical protein
MDAWSFLYFLGCTLGWGFSTFIMGFIGKENIAFETALFYQSIGAVLIGVSVIWRVEFGMSYNHMLCILNGISFTLADLSYYMVSRHPYLHNSERLLSFISGTPLMICPVDRARFQKLICFFLKCSSLVQD